MAADSDLHDPSLDALMREHSAEAPSPHVDSAILASAHEAVRLEVHRTKAGRFFRIALPIAAAASIAVVIVHLQPVVPTPPQSTKPTPVERPRFDSARPEDTRKEDPEKRTERSDTTVQAPEARAPGRADAAPSSTPARAAAQALSIQIVPNASTPDQWIARIRRLRDESKRQEALEELARFRATFPDADARRPEDLRALR